MAETSRTLARTSHWPPQGGLRCYTVSRAGDHRRNPAWWINLRSVSNERPVVVR